MVDDDASCYQREEPEDVANVLVSLADFNEFSGADDQVSMVDDDFEVFLLDFVKSYIFFKDFLAFMVQQVKNKLRTWT